MCQNSIIHKYCNNTEYRYVMVNLQIPSENIVLNRLNRSSNASDVNIFFDLIDT